MGKPETQEEAFDDLAHSIQTVYCGDTLVSELLAAGLNACGAVPTWEPEAVYERMSHSATLFADMVLASTTLTLAQKWAIQRLFRERAVNGSKIGSMFGKTVFTDRAIASRMVHSGYVGLKGYANPKWERRCSILGNVGRWLENIDNAELEHQILGLTSMLGLRAGTRIELGIDADSKPYVSGEVAARAA